MQEHATPHAVLSRETTEPLPLNIQGMRAFLTDILLDIVAVHKGVRSASSVRDWIELGKYRLPAILSDQAVTRDGIVAAIQQLVEEESQALGPEMTWPPDSDWLKMKVDGYLEDLIETMSMDCGFLLPGSAEFMERRWHQSQPLKLLVDVGDHGRHQAQTEFFKDPDTDETIQLRLDRRGTRVILSFREQGQTEWQPLKNEFKPHYAKYLAALFKWLETTYRAPL